MHLWGRADRDQHSDCLPCNEHPLIQNATLVERMKNRKMTGLNREVQAVRYPCISVTRGARVEGFVEVRLGVKKGKEAEYLRLQETKPGLFPLPQTTARAIAKVEKSKQRNPSEDAPWRVAPKVQFMDVFALGM